MKRNDSAGGKGDNPRPFNVSAEDYSKKWDDIFGKKAEEKKCGNCLKCKCETKEKE